MHLEREHLAHVEELDQQREATEAAGQHAEQLLRRLLHQMTDRLPLERTIGNATRVVVSIAQHPRLADWSMARQRRGQQVGEAPAAPGRYW